MAGSQHPSDAPKSPDSLTGHYENTAGRNSFMLLNVAPTTTGRFAPASVAAIDGFAAEPRMAFTLDHAVGVPAQVGDAQVTSVTNGNTRDGEAFAKGDYTPMVLDLQSAKPVSRLGISEDIVHAGMTVKTFKVEAELDGTWTEVATSGVIGAQRILKFEAPVTAQRWRITVTDERDTHTISDIRLWGQLTADPGKISDVYVDCAVPTAGDGTQEKPFNSLEQFRKTELATGATLHFKAGTDCADADVEFWGYGTAEAPVTTTTTETVTASATATATASTTSTVTVIASSSPSSSVSPSVGNVDVYGTPGFHRYNVRHWYTQCEPYSQTLRCRTEIWSTTIKMDGGKFVSETGWHFNNLTYLPKMTRNSGPATRWATPPHGPRTKGGAGAPSATPPSQARADVAATSGRRWCRAHRSPVVDTPTLRSGSGCSTTW